MGRLDIAPAAVPDAVAAVIERRLARLTEAVVALLRVAAVAGKSFDAEVVASIADAFLDDAAAALETATAAGILTRIDHATSPATTSFTKSYCTDRSDAEGGYASPRRGGVHAGMEADPSFHAVIADHLDRAGPEAVMGGGAAGTRSV